MIYERYASNPDFGAYFIIWEDASFNNPTAEYCARTKDLNGLTMPVLFWVNEQDPVTLGLDERHVDLVMERGARIIYRAQFNDSGFQPEIERLLNQ